MSNSDVKSTNIDWKKLILKTFVAALITTLMTACFGYLLTLITSDDMRIIISPSIKDDNYYVTTIFLTNAKKCHQTNIMLNLAQENDLIDIESQKGISVSGNNVTFECLQPKETIPIIIKTEQQVNKDQIFSSNTKKVSSYMIYEERSNPILLLLIEMLVYFFALLLALYFSESKANQFQNKLLATQSRIDEFIKKEEKNEKEREKQIQSQEMVLKSHQLRLHRLRIFYQLRIRDLTKELDFWKNTVRKLVYNSKSKYNTADQLFEIATKELKTYSTRENQTDIDEITYLAKEFADEEKKEH